ncbi:hypothetical protein [Pseudomonas synxantha]|uniref:Ca2+/H+ antiporter n=1 Tax=Pseudomonas synxantha TaxID=47883 RepID=A0ACC6JUC2_9PSED|nr:hypothetical protein [Pseudomonas synxantha]MDR6609950.1 Ca2+/H+ antiporter [Pseudomonas synxantha]
MAQLPPTGALRQDQTELLAEKVGDPETNAIEGMTHFVLFATFIMLSLLGL